MRFGGGWMPTKLGGCVLWLRAANGVSKSGANVSSWADRSGLGNDVTAYGTGSPQYVASGIGGRPSITMNAANGQFFANTSRRLFVKDGARHVFAVVAATAGGPLYPLGGWVFTNPYDTLTTDPAWSVMWATFSGNSYGYTDTTTGSDTINTGSVTTAASLIEMSGAAGTGSGKHVYRVNAALKTLSSTNKKAETDAVGFTIGSASYTTRSFCGQVAEFVIFNRVLAAQEAAAVRSFLASWYGLTLS